jgi:hypothetical protein
MEALEHWQTTEGMMMPAPGEVLVVRTTIVDNTIAAQRPAKHWARENEDQIAAGVWMVL